MKDIRVRTAAFALLAAFALSACGGGGSSSALPGISSTPVPGGGSTTSSQPGTAAFSIAVPAASSSASNARRAQYVSSNTGSMRISVLSVNGANVTVPDTVAPIAYGAKGCTTDKSQPLQCTILATAPIGQTVAFRISTYASQDGSGGVLATSTLSAAVGATAGTPIPLDLGGVVDHVTISPNRFVAPTDGTLQTYLVSVTPVDASGAVIVGSSQFSSPIQLSTQNDPNGALTLTQTTVSSAGQPVQLKFDSSKQVTDAKIVASIGTGTKVEADFVTLDYTPNAPTLDLAGAPVTVAVSEVGFTGQFSVSMADPTVASASISATTNGTATITISPPPPGSYDGQTTLQLSDGTTTGKLPIKVIYPLLQMTDWSVGGAPVAIAPSSDGTNGYYFADMAGDRVGEFIPSGSGQVFNVQSSVYGVAAVALGPDGNPWWVIGGWPQAQLCNGSFFRGQFGHNCYNINGTFSQAASWGLTRGPNNTLWMTFSQWGSAAIASYNIGTGQFTFYTNGLNANANPTYIAYGPDGNVWFTDASQSQPAIGKLDTSSGTIAEYALQTGDGTPGDGTATLPQTIVVGPDGNLWFADNAMFHPGIGKVVPSTGAVTEYTSGLQRGSHPSAMAIGPDGKLWFSDQGKEYLLGTVDTSTGVSQEYSLSIKGFMPGPLLTLGNNLEVMDTGGIVGQPFGAYAGQVTLPGVSASATQRRKAP